MNNKNLTEIRKQLARKGFEKSNFDQLVGIEFVDIGEGWATLKLKMQDKLKQPQGILHGGATATLIDTAMAFAVISKLAEDEKAATVNLTVHYLRSVIKGEIVCTARIVKAGKRLLTVSAEVVNDEEKMTATAISTYSKI